MPAPCSTPRSAAAARSCVTFNYRYAPKHQKIKELLMSGAIGRVTSVDFSWYLDTTHGADYFRRWHRLREKSGSLWVHKATHHFDLVNWWLDADPVEVSAFGSLQRYGKNGALPADELPPVPAQGAVPVPLGHHEEPEPRGALRRLREGRRLPARRLRLQGGRRHPRHDERGRASTRTGVDDELLAQRLHADRGLPPGVQRHQGPPRGARLRAPAVAGADETEMHRDQELRRAREDRHPQGRGRPRRRRRRAARPDLPRPEAARAPAACPARARAPCPA